MSPSLQEFAHLQIPLEVIQSATNNFAHENLIGKGGFGKVYKGQLLWGGQFINIVARQLDRANGQGDVQFLTEISMLSRLRHKNLVSIVGFCDEDGEKIIVNKHEANASLDKYLSGPTLTWMQRLYICVSAARALSYIHYDIGRSYSIIHRNFKSSKILLDENWEAKLCGFGLSMSNTVGRRHHPVLAEPCGTIGYVDPVCVEMNNVTLKSDVYSLGVVLFEVLFGRIAMIRIDGEWKNLAPLAKEHYQAGKLDEMIDPYLRKQMDPQSFTIFSEVAYQCLGRQRARRPDMENVVRILEKALELQWKLENPEILETCIEDASSSYLKGKNLEHLKIRLKDIVLATENFAQSRCIGSGGYGMVYKAELAHFDINSLLAIEGKNKDELPKKRSSVALKQVFTRQDGQGEQGFIAEIEMLTSCRHRNIVSLLGFCDEGHQKIIVYEFASNGSLDEFLGNSDHHNLITLTWLQRIKICLDTAHGLEYLHKRMIIHRDIKSANILLDKNWEAKIADFGLSRFLPTSTVNTFNVAGTEVYIDPEYMKTGRLRKESDTYSFGIVLFEMMFGRLAYDEIYITDDGKPFASMLRQCFIEGNLKEMVDPKIKEETDERIFTLFRGPNQDSMDTFVKVAFQCLAETQDQRPTMEVVIKELEKALYFQENNEDKLKMSLADIELATQNFSDQNFIGRGGFGMVYKGKISHSNGHRIVGVKRFRRGVGQGEHEFFTELKILFEYKHEKFIGLVGYCHELGEKVIVYEYASRGSLDKYLKDRRLTWMKRLEICMDVARGLDFLHGSTVVKQEVVIHRDIKSANILLNGDWKAKISDFGLSLVCPMNEETDYVIDNAAGTPGYCDPLYYESSVFTKESDIYSFGMVLYEILCGKLPFEDDDDRRQFPRMLAKDELNVGRVF